MDNEIIVNKTALQMINKSLEEVGVCDKKPFEVLARLLDAKKMTVDKFGEEHLENDNTAQAKAVEMVLRLKKILDNKVEDTKFQTMLIQVSPADIDRLESITSELKDLQERLNSNNIHKGKIIEVEYENAKSS